MKNHTLKQFSSNFDTLGNSKTLSVCSEKKIESGILAILLLERQISIFWKSARFATSLASLLSKNQLDLKWNQAWEHWQCWHFITSKSTECCNIKVLQNPLLLTTFRQTNINFLEKCTGCQLFGQCFKQKKLDLKWNQAWEHWHSWQSCKKYRKL